MARDLPDPLRLRDIKYGAKTPDSVRSSTARLFLEQRRYAEALDLFLLAGDREGIAEIREFALREGRLVLLIMLRRGGETFSSDEWRRAGQAALAAERPREAYRCFFEAGDEESQARVQELLPGYEVFIPQGK